MTISNYPMGNVGETPRENVTYLNANYTEDRYTFSITGRQSVNLNLHGISSGDADLSLYQDMNGNGVLDAGEPLLGSSARGSTADDSLNMLVGSSGQINYIAVVNRYAPGSGPDGRLDYHLQMSATPVFPNATNAPNLLPKEFALPGMNTSSSDVPYSVTESVSASDTCDTYTLSVGARTLANLQLTGLSNDADIRVIRDLDSDRVVDGNEVMAYSRNAGIQSESIPNIGPGDYFVQIYSYDGNPTNYTLSVSHSHFV